MRATVKRYGAVVIAVALAGLCGVASQAEPATMTIGPAGCGAPPPSLSAGPVSFSIVNQAKAFATVYLIDPAGTSYAELPSLTPGRTLPLATTLAAGSYALRCVFTDGTVRTSATFTLTGTTTGAVAGYRPLPDLAMAGPVSAYRAWIKAQLPALLAACQQLDTDLAQGNLTSAKTDWQTAHLDYERLGAAYNSFGDFDDSINGRADGLPRGTATPDWTGLHAIEYALWHNATATQLRPLTQSLLATVTGLIADFPSEEIDPGDLPLRAHEILENTLEFQLTGDADYGSGSTLATAYANTQGTNEVLTVLAPLIATRDPKLLATITTDLTTVQTALLATRTPAGDWIAPQALPTTTRQHLDGVLGELLEQLAVLPNLLAPRTSG